ncbi:type III-A CRISPR-associated protein Csm2 [Nostoc sp. 'Peltigera membranacea cyanobiont' N6]|uniref:type III-A CRISPR-associated protein Csm2 n=1 Tax=Nostoc sp. 'Peltigera membranacea cyanobiont' N6 TaxID=1261031 RepID=UPI000CF301CE|nr:type III-A CRISPR-associated protein Csm2 [Nostoc sp. 'Peltigera membranacea cyanobiont' N6]AVH61972.1 CRISPR-associated protein Csm2 [Nostoc sp. 'Peltigera membranacea cyanobiont' N6]
MSQIDTQKPIVDQITTTIKGLKDGLKTYPIRDLVKHAEKFGPYLKQQRLETNQVRKFLDAINQIKAILAQQDDDKEIQKELEIIQKQAENDKQEAARKSENDISQKLNGKDKEEEIKKIKDSAEQELIIILKNIQKQADNKKDKLIFPKIEADVVLLKPKLAYAAARQRSAKPLEEVISVAIDKVESTKDFERLVQLIESIIAYHKAEGGK